MKSFKEFISEQKEIKAANVYGANINEILYGFYMAGSWSEFEGETQSELEKNKTFVSPQEYIDQDERAKVMAIETKKWMSENGYGKVIKVWWTNRPGMLTRAIGHEVDSKKNPADILVKTIDDKFLGLSAKSTKSSGEIGFKNPGLGAIEKALNLNLKVHLNDATSSMIDQHKLPTNATARKKAIRDNEEIQSKTKIIGLDVMEKIRDDLYTKLMSLSQENLRFHIFEDWMDINESLLPPYIKVTGHGKNGKYSASIVNPIRNTKLDALNSENITIEKVGKDSIGIKAAKKIMKMRVKFESEKMASSVKFSGESW